MHGSSQSVLKVTQESFVAYTNKQLKQGYTISAGHCQIAEHSHTWEVSDLLLYTTYELQWSSRSFLHSSHSSSPLHLPSCNEWKRHTLCRVWDPEQWMKFLWKLYLQKGPANVTKIFKSVQNTVELSSVLLRRSSKKAPHHTQHK